MQDDPDDPNRTDDEALASSPVEELRILPSEQSRPSAETDAVVLSLARETLSSIRRRNVMRQRIWPTLAAAACIIFALILFLNQREMPHTYVGQTFEIDSNRITVRKDKNGVIVTERSNDNLHIKARSI